MIWRFFSLFGALPVVASLQDGSHLLVCVLLYSPLPHCTRIGLCDQQHMAQMIVCHSWGKVIKDTAASVLVAFSLSLSVTLSASEASCHIVEQFQLTRWGPEAPSQRPHEPLTIAPTADSPATASSEVLSQTHLTWPFQTPDPQKLWEILDVVLSH